MKKILLTILAAAAVFAGCERQEIVNRGYGEFCLGGMELNSSMNDSDVNLGKNTVASKSRSARMTDSEIVNSLKISLVSHETDGYSREWASFSEIAGKPVEVPAGMYTVTASSPETAPAAWNQPIYSGSADFPVKVGEMTAATINCAITNMAVTVKCAPEFMEKMTDGFEIKVISKTDKSAFLVWKSDMFDAATGELNMDNARNEGWFNVDDLDVYVTGRWTLDGQGHDIDQLVASLEGLKAKDRVILTVNAQMTGAIGKENGISIIIDKTVNNKDVQLPPVGGIDLEEVPDEPVGPVDPIEPGNDAPTISWTGITDFDAMDMQAAIDNNAAIHIVAPGKINVLKVKIESAELNKILTEVNLADPGELEEGLASMLPIGDKVKGKESLDIGLSGLLPMLYSLCDSNREANDKSAHTFTVVLEDADGTGVDAESVASCTFVYNAPAGE